MPNDPCRGCKIKGRCCDQGPVNRSALWAWLDGQGFECADYDPDYFHGIEGVAA